MYGIVRVKQFENSFRKLKKSGLFKPSVAKDLEILIDLLAEGKTLPVSYTDHQLKGELKQYRECHIRGDLLLVYERRHTQLILILVDIGTHSYLFG